MTVSWVPIIEIQKLFAYSIQCSFKLLLAYSHWNCRMYSGHHC